MRTHVPNGIQRTFEGERICNRCNILKPLEDFTKTSKAHNASCRTYSCKACHAIEANKRYHATGGLPQRYAIHAASAKRAGVNDTLDRDELSSVLEHKECYYCKLPSDNKMGIKMWVDHVIPFKHGGENTLENIVLACECCNRAKHDKTREQYEAWLGFIKG